jgi:HAD superfamily hydrolase (TIGR01509 family)
MMVKALIWDVDGTLAETEEVHRAAFNAAFEAAGMNWHWDQPTYARLLKVTGGKERIRAHAAVLGLPCVDATALHAEKTAHYVALMRQGRVSLRPGVAALMAEARARGLRLAIATTTSPANVTALAQAVWQRSAEEVFDVIAAGDEVTAKKPAPDVYKLALARLGLPADLAIAIEDSLNGLRAAQGAGLRCVVAPGLYTGVEDLSAADWLVPDLTHWTLPR